MSKKLKIGIIGCANIAERYMINSIKDNQNFELVVIATNTESKVQVFKNKFDTNVVLGYEEIFKFDIDCVYIPLPNSLHYEWGMKCLQKGKNLIIEKSIGCSLQQTKELSEYAIANDLTILESFQFRFHPVFKKVKDLLNSNDFGEIRLLKSYFGFPPFSDKNNIRYQKNLGGGALLDVGAYPLKISQLLLGPGLKVMSSKINFIKDFNVDIWGAAMLLHSESGISSQIAFGFDNYYENSLEIWGSKGKIFVPRMFTSPPYQSEKIVTYNASGRNELILSAEDQFSNLLDYFYFLVHSEDNRHYEHQLNIDQSRLIEEVMLNEK